jgi:hypothetical protein
VGPGGGNRGWEVEVPKGWEVVETLVKHRFPACGRVSENEGSQGVFPRGGNRGWEQGVGTYGFFVYIGLLELIITEGRVRLACDA